MEFVKKIDDWLAKIEAGCVILILSLMIVFSFGQMILRNLFNTGIPWADILLRQMVLWVGFLGASLATRDERHISIDILTPFLPSFWKSAIGTVVRIATAIACSFLTWAAWKFIAFEKVGGSTLFLNLPVWIFQTILPFSFAVIALRLLLRALREISAFGKCAPAGDKGKAA